MKRPFDPSPFLPLPHKRLDILLALAEGESHGYGIKRFVETLGHGKLRAATLYDGLARLHRDGLIRETATRPDDAGSTRWRYYVLTDQGRTVLEAELARLRSIVDFAQTRGLVLDES
ncbi:MAG: PadR family transcriptional regulator [Acidobacteriota bacterium]